MKIFGTVVKILTALAAVAGAIYVIATYGDKIVAWAKNLLNKYCCCEEDCCCGDACCCDKEDCCDEECCCEKECCCEEEGCCEEAPAEAAEEAAPEAEDTDFVG